MSLADQYKESRERVIKLAGIEFHIRQPDVRRILTVHKLTSAAYRAIKETKVTGEDEVAQAMAHHADLRDLNKAVLDDCCDQVTLDSEQVSDTVIHADDLGAHDLEILAAAAYGLWGRTLDEMAVIAPFRDTGDTGEESDPVGDAPECADSEPGGLPLRFNV